MSRSAAESPLETTPCAPTANARSASPSSSTPGVEDHVDVGVLGAQPAAELEAVDARALQRDVEHDHPRMMRAHAVQRLLGVAGERDDVDLGPVVEQRAQAEDDHLMVVDENDRNGERGHSEPCAILVERSLTAQAFRSTRWWCSGQRQSHPERVRRDRGSARHSENMAHVDELADGALRPFHGLSGRPGGDATNRPDRVRRRTSPAAGRRPAGARTPPSRDRGRTSAAARRPAPARPPRAPRPRARPAASRRRPPVPAAARRVARMTSRAALSRSSASRPVRCSSPGSCSRSSASKRPASAPSATACSVVTSVRSRCVSRSSSSAVSADTSRRAAWARSAASRSTVRASSSRAASGSCGATFASSQPAASPQRASATQGATGGTGSTWRRATGPPLTRTAARPARSKRSSKPDIPDLGHGPVV